MTPEALVLCTLARHGLLGTDLPDMLDLWPEVAVVKVVCDPKPATARKHPGERICARCNHWAPTASYPRGGNVCRACVAHLVVA